MPSAHRLEHRADMLAQKMRDSTAIFARQMGEGEQPPFTTALTEREALEWWRQHRHDEYGAAVLKRYTPQQILDLDLRLVRWMNPDETPQGAPQPLAIPGAAQPIAASQPMGEVA